MNNEIRVAATVSVENRLSLIDGLIPVRTGKKNCFAIDTGVEDENGVPVYATIDITIKSTANTKTTTAFDINKAIAERAEYDAKPKKEPSIKADSAEVEARRAKREAEQELVKEWCIANLDDKKMTTTDIKNAIPELEGTTIMQFGTYLKNIAQDESNGIVREVEKGKPYYRKA